MKKIMLLLVCVLIASISVFAELIQDSITPNTEKPTYDIVTQSYIDTNKISSATISNCQAVRKVYNCTITINNIAYHKIINPRIYPTNFTKSEIFDKEINQQIKALAQAENKKNKQLTPQVIIDSKETHTKTILTEVKTK